MACIECGSATVSERPERTAQDYRRFHCRTCGRQFNERSVGTLNRTQYPSDVIAFGANADRTERRPTANLSGTKLKFHE
jgi:hypothetical protein